MEGALFNFISCFSACLRSCNQTTVTHLSFKFFLGCCFACESNRKKVVHPFYDKYLGGREFQEDEVDCGNDFPIPLDVDYLF